MAWLFWFQNAISLEFDSQLCASSICYHQKFYFEVFQSSLVIFSVSMVIRSLRTILPPKKVHAILWWLRWSDATPYFIWFIELIVKHNSFNQQSSIGLILVGCLISNSWPAHINFRIHFCVKLFHPIPKIKGCFPNIEQSEGGRVGRGKHLLALSIQYMHRLRPFASYGAQKCVTFQKFQWKTNMKWKKKYVDYNYTWL